MELTDYAGFDGLSMYTGTIILTELILRVPKPWNLDKEYNFIIADDKTFKSDYIYG